MASGELVEGTASEELAASIEQRQSAFLASVEEEEAKGQQQHAEAEAVSDQVTCHTGGRLLIAGLQEEEVNDEEVEEETEEEDPLYCKICCKAFKATKQMRTHLKSKKHLKAAAAAAAAAAADEQVVEEHEEEVEQEEVEQEAAAQEAAPEATPVEDAAADKEEECYIVGAAPVSGLTVTWIGLNSVCAAVQETDAVSAEPSAKKVNTERMFDYQ